MSDITPQKAATVTIQLLPGMTTLTIVLVVLKAFGKLEWSWWYVFAPMWGPWVAIFGLFALLLAGVGVIAAALFIWEVPYDSYKTWRRNNAKCASCGQRRGASVHSFFGDPGHHYFKGK